MKAVIEVENLGKEYRLGSVGSKTLKEDTRNILSRLGMGKKAEGSQKQERFWAVRDISFSVEPGQVLGIVGKNGAGKSTLLKILSRVTAPTTGRIRAKGRIASLLEVGTGFHPELTGRENIFLNGAILGMTRNETRTKLDEIIAFSGVEKYVDTPVKRYSSGMYVRLAFAVAAHLESEILVMDEVLAVGDAEFQRKCLGKMNDVAQNEGRTVLFVSHNMAAVNQLCNSALFLKKGLLVHQGPVSSIIDLYLEADAPAYTQDNALTILKSARLRRVQEVRNGEQFGHLVTLEFVLDLPADSAGRLSLEMILRHRETSVFTASNAYHSDLILQPGMQTVVCEIGPINWHLGRYDIDLMLVEPKVRTVEHHEAALQVNIETQVARNHHHAQFPAGSHGLFTPAQRWYVEE
jgi:lipopolysaccharide transport system ATP-binding protein